ncbi:glycosyltransferase family 2 protein [Paenibacillus sp. P96]|uniref:Glycosyltransferase family 2 protein n=1 Tax=Paenibacillus zeirhizosphaerae TaxID=2987519 RepID=A0ABT9FTG7_9BACL|nr:glycosyltransferase family 2 protein [Paenibacillus sp. P96]MDP4098024.1 glycosyltransferase family 2 protein [Paenibacillus sp. P96]
MIALSIAICTRNREDDLKRCISSIAQSTLPASGLQVEVLIVDDGALTDQFLKEQEQILKPTGMELRYHRKKQPGLWLSRVETLEVASGDIILFLDDDVELPVDYIQNLMHTYEEYPQAAGVGGVAIGMSNSFFGTIRCLLSFQQSLFKGKLSLSGQSGSMYNWHKARKTFKTEFFHGCNMSFRKEAIRGLKPVPWLQSYSVGEDLLLSRFALKSGPLYINPLLKLFHHESPSSRDNMEHVAYMRVMNHIHLLRDEQSGPIKYAALWWTTMYFMLRERPKKNNSAIKGYKKALKAMFSNEVAG